MAKEGKAPSGCGNADASPAGAGEEMVGWDGGFGLVVLSQAVSARRGRSVMRGRGFILVCYFFSLLLHEVGEGGSDVVCIGGVGGE